MSNILLHMHNQVATITLDRPDKLNSFIRPMAMELQKVLDHIAADEQVRCIVITGKGKAFCAGQDLQEATDPHGPPLSKIVSEHYNPIVVRLRSITKPIIAAVNGVAAGAGANIGIGL